MTKNAPPFDGPPPPRAGGSYVFDPETGERRPADAPVEAPRNTAPAAASDDTPDPQKKGPRK